ncbi:MAG: VOC family protein [Pseudomonadota bacterium]
MMNWRVLRKTDWELLHLGLVVVDAERVLRKYDSLGLLTAVGEFPDDYTPPRFEVTDYQRSRYRADTDTSGNDRTLSIKQARLGPLPIEVLQLPRAGIDPNSEFLNQRGEGVAHIGFLVDDLEAETARLVNAGVKVLLVERMNDAVTMRYFDLREFGGVVLELKQKGTW